MLPPKRLTVVSPSVGGITAADSELSAPIVLLFVILHFFFSFRPPCPESNSVTPRWAMTLLALLSALSECPQRWQTNSACERRLSL